MQTRTIYFFSIIVVAIVLGASMYLQYHDGFIPCPLCILQRYALGIIGSCFVIGLFINGVPTLRYFIHFLIMLASILGIVLAGRQIWLQQFYPGDTTECGVSLQYMLKVLPLSEVMTKVFAGSAECSKRGFEFLTLNMAEWSLLIFVMFLVISFYLLAIARKE